MRDLVLGFLEFLMENVGETAECVAELVLLVSGERVLAVAVGAASFTLVVLRFIDPHEVLLFCQRSASENEPVA